MIDVAALREALATACAETDIADVTPYAYAPNGPVVPCVYPDEWSVDFGADGVPLDGETGLYAITMVVLASGADDKSGQQRRDELLRAARTALHSDDTLSGLVGDVVVTAMRAPADLREVSGQNYIAGEIDVQVLA